MTTGKDLKSVLEERGDQYVKIGIVDLDGVLRRVLDRAEQSGFTVKAGFEYEFFVFEETAESLQQKKFINLTPLSQGAFGYSVLRNCEHAGFYRAMLDGCAAAGILIESLIESASGVRTISPVDGQLFVTRPKSLHFRRTIR